MEKQCINQGSYYHESTSTVEHGPIFEDSPSNGQKYLNISTFQCRNSVFPMNAVAGPLGPSHFRNWIKVVE